MVPLVAKHFFRSADFIDETPNRLKPNVDENPKSPGTREADQCSRQVKMENPVQAEAQFHRFAAKLDEFNSRDL